MVRSLIAKLELGASVIFTIGIALKRVEDQIKKNTEVLEKIFAEGLRLSEEVKPAAASNCCGLGELRPYLDTTLSLLSQQLVALRKPYPVQVQEGSGTASATTDSTPERDNLAAFEGLARLLVHDFETRRPARGKMERQAISPPGHKLSCLVERGRVPVGLGPQPGFTFGSPL